MRRLGVLLLCLMGCSEPPVVPEVPIPVRNPTAPIASQVDARLARLNGDWVVVQGAGLQAGSQLRFGASTMLLDGVSLPVADKGQGRLDLAGEALWIHWLDVDNRTAALGDPEGSRVWIMDRTGRPGERMRAARETLAWYGYDLSRME